MHSALRIENLSKRYRLGVINRDMLYKDLQSRWAKFRGKEDPNAPIGAKHDRRLEHGDEFWALRNVDLEVREGEILGIIGRNGAGKSTLLKILSQITAPTEGRINVKGRIASLLEVGTGFHPELTGRENVYLNGAILGMTRKEVASKFDEIVGFANIDEFIDTPVKRYSSGMYVRLAFAVAAHLNPDILIIDEVLAVGDAEFQQKCLRKMGHIANGGRTILFVSHQISMVRKLCSQVAWMDGGCIRKSGRTEEVIAAYLGNHQAASSLSATVQDLDDRKGNGHLQASMFRCFDAADNEVYQFRSGEACQFVIEVGNRTSNLYTGISVSVDVHDNAGNRVLLYHTKLVNGDFDVGAGGVRLRLFIPSLPLAPGLFRLSVYVGKDNYETFDYVDKVAVIEIIDGDFYSTGHAGYPTHCSILSQFQVSIASRPYNASVESRVASNLQ